MTESTQSTPTTVDEAFKAAMTSLGAWHEARREHGPNSAEAKAAYVAYTADEERWAALRDQTEERRAA